MGRNRITLLSYGTRGDVQPLMALAAGLRADGWTVTLGADAEYEPEIRRLGLGYAPVRMNVRELLTSSAGRRAWNGDASDDDFDELAWRMLDDCWAAAQDADALVYDTMLTPVGHIAARLRIPAMMTSVMPNMSPTRAFPLIGAPAIGWGAWGNRLSYELYRLSWLKASSNVRRWTAARLQMTPRRTHNYWYLRGRRIPILYSYSPHVLPIPADWPPEWYAGGYRFLDGSALMQPPAALRQFLDAGPAPIYIGLGSLVGVDPEPLTGLILSALERTGQRAIIVNGWGGILHREFPSSVLALPTAPYDWIFPHVRAVVHQGGSGATAAALRFGRPSVVLPFITDQFLWARIISERGWGLAIPLRELTADALVNAVRDVLADEDMARRVGAASRVIQREEGTARAVEFARRHLAHAPGHQSASRGASASAAGESWRATSSSLS